MDALLVSIHALLAECDSPFPTCRHSPPVSIHALLAECDGSLQRLLCSLVGFNPRTPCGVRLPTHSGRLSVKGFQSTHSLRSATGILAPFNPVGQVSIHALLAECDRVIVVRGLLR